MCSVFTTLTAERAVCVDTKEGEMPCLFNFLFTFCVLVGRVEKLTRYSRDRVSSCNIYAVQQDTQSVLMSEFIHHVCQFDMFRTSPVHHQERFVQAVFADFGMWYYCAYYSTRPAVTK